MMCRRLTDGAWRPVFATLAAGLTVAWMSGSLGCSESRPALADRDVSPPTHVRLPSGFDAMESHYNPQNPEDHYNGWPRYIISRRDGMMMAYVPTQTMTFGGGKGNDEIPSRVITVPHFYIDIHEVTNEQFAAFCRKSGRPVQIKYWAKGTNDAHPVRAVTWTEANDYASWADKSLPTEAQWEAAARGSDRRIYPWGNDDQVENVPYLCNAKTPVEGFDGHEFTAPVLSYAAGVSPFGVFNLAGNVAEWCYDWYDLSRYAWPTEEDLPGELIRGAKPFGQRNYPNDEYKTIRESFVGPVHGSRRVVRGGSFTDPIENCRVDARMGVRPEARQHNIGFRCVLTLPLEEDMAVAMND